jgi:putative oxidoreductase
MICLKNCLAVRKMPMPVDVALLLVRLVCGAAFLFHGWMKIQHPMSWMPPESPVPGFLQMLAAISEFGGGLALVLGLLARLGSLGIVCTMTVAVTMHAFMFGDPFVHPTGGRSFELPLTYLVVALLILIAGPGRLSIDHKIFGDK